MDWEINWDWEDPSSIGFTRTSRKRILFNVYCVLCRYKILGGGMAWDPLYCICWVGIFSGAHGCSGLLKNNKKIGDKVCPLDLTKFLFNT